MNEKISVILGFTAVAFSALIIGSPFNYIDGVLALGGILNAWIAIDKVFELRSKYERVNRERRSWREKVSELDRYKSIVDSLEFESEDVMFENHGEEDRMKVIQ